MPKRILIFSLAYYPSHVSGAEIAIREITDRIDPNDIEFSMVTHRFRKDILKTERIGNVLVHRVGFGPSYLSKILFVPLAALKAAALNREKRFDASWVMMTYMLFPLVLAKLCGLRGPYLLTLQDGDPYEKVFERWFIRPVAQVLDWGFRNATMVQAISTYLATWPKRRGYKYEVAVIPNGASLESGRSIEESELEPIRKILEKKEGDIFLLSIGRLVHQKAIDVVIRALALLPPHVKLAVVGEGPERESLGALAEELGVADRVKFVGHIERTETAKYRKVCDIYVVPSRSEGQGISFLSTMLSGIPVVTTQEGGIADFLFDRVRNPEKPTTGWAVDVDSPEQIKAAVEDILADPERARAVVTQARAMIERTYSWDSIARAMESKAFGIVLRPLVHTK
jgi:glycosyltransferase involved in cell wall biosynthesis